MNTLPRPRPLVVVILDGWGLRLETKGNAIAAAHTPTIDLLERHFPATAIAASGLAVGLPADVGGNSETGHRNIGAGRVEYQILASIDRAIKGGSFAENTVLLGALEHATDQHSALHLLGLVSRGGVHSQFEHLVALLQLLKQRAFARPVYIHMITDGRDAPPRSGLGYAHALEKIISELGIGQIASVVGRFYAMDRNNNWERTEKAYRLLTAGDHELGAASAVAGIDRAYRLEVTDEMIPPLALTRAGAPLATIADNDAVIFFNFRPDRARQLAQAFAEPAAVPFTAKKFHNLYFATLGHLGANLPVPAAFFEDKAEWPLARVISEAHLRQLHIAETEKYAHVTYYLNVGHEEPFPGEEHVLIPSGTVRSFADTPEMAAGDITNTVLAALGQGTFDVYFLNYANPDMVGHTGNFAAAVAACECIDRCLGQLLAATLAARGALVVTADHGKVEDLLSGEAYLKTEHTRNPVPFYLARPELKRSYGRSDTEVRALRTEVAGVLADVAPTILDILRLPKPPTMTGVSLLGSI